MQIMGILNATPDSFSDGGQCVLPHVAMNAARAMIAHGASIIDVGGESSRPGAQPVSADEELSRVLPVITSIRAYHATMPISIDTTKAVVAERAIAAGATMVNDISAGRADPEMLALVANANVQYILMHMQGEPRTMQNDPHYTDVVSDVCAFLRERLVVAESAGIARSRCLIDPGIGFGKRPEHNITIMQHLSALVEIGVPVVLGASRKAIIGHLLGGVGVDERLEGSLAMVAVAAQHDIDIVRVHDVSETQRFLTVFEASTVPCNNRADAVDKPL